MKMRKIVTTQQKCDGPDQRSIRSIEVTIFTRRIDCGPTPWQQHHHKARDGVRSAMKGERKYTSIWDRWQNDEVYRTSQLAHNWTDAAVR